MYSATSAISYTNVKQNVCLNYEEAERIYALLSEGGEIFMKMEETFFAFRFAMLRDRFGTSWMILHERPRP